MNIGENDNQSKNKREEMKNHVEKKSYEKNYKKQDMCGIEHCSIHLGCVKASSCMNCNLPSSWRPLLHSCGNTLNT